MMRVRCPDCDARLEVDDTDLGQEVRCPSCRAVFTARPEGEPPPPPDLPPRRRPEWDDDRPRRPRDDEFVERPRRRRGAAEFYDESPEDIVEDGRDAVRVPAILSIVACVVTILYHGADTIITLTNPQILKNNPLFPGGPPSTEMIVGIKLIQLLYQLVVIAGSIAMMRLRLYKFAMTAMVMQVIPCAGVCCLLGLPIGIWGLVVLNRADVKLGYELVEREQTRAERRRDDGADEL